MEIWRVSSRVNSDMLSLLAAMVGGGVVLRLRGEIRSGVVTRETRRFFFVDARTERMIGNGMYICQNDNDTTSRNIVAVVMGFT